MAIRTINNQEIDYRNISSIINGIQCPRCSSTNSIRIGKENGTQRYKCKRCGRNHRDTTNTTIHRIQKKSQITQYLECMEQGLSLRKAAKACKISLGTAFAWRHKFLKGMQKEYKQNSNKLSLIGILETPYSIKGQKNRPLKTQQSVKNLMIITNDELITIKKLSSKQTAKETMLFTKGEIEKMKHNSNIKGSTFSRLNKITTKISNQTGDLLLEQKLNLAQLDIDQWISKFRGVATKYLQNYWNWFSYNYSNQNAEFVNKYRILLATMALETNKSTKEYYDPGQ